MLVTFSCKAYPNTTYFGEIAQTLLKMMGKSGNVPGALFAEDVPEALEKLQSAIEKLKAESSINASNQKNADQDDWKDKPVSLAHRAIPLIDLLSAAAKAHCNVMWDQNQRNF
jgi:hypothetical protein